MFLRLATLGALGYAAYQYYDKNREQVDDVLRRLAERGRSSLLPDEGSVEVAGGPLSREAKVVHAGEGPVA